MTQDDPRQAAKATTWIRKAVRNGGTLFVNRVVLCELVWVLETAYKQTQPVISDVIEKLLLEAQIEIEDRDTVWTALDSYRHGKADFADSLIGRSNLSQSCVHTVTFDQSLANDPAFRLL